MLGRDLNGIVSTFNVTITRLEDLIGRNANTIVVNNDRMERLRSESETLAGESAKALNVRNKIAALVS